MQPTKRPTLHDVAARAGVSVTTASRVVSPKVGVRVRDDTVQRVQEAIAELGYRPDHRARMLRQGEQRAKTLGVVVADISNPFSSKLLSGIESVARDRETLVLIVSTEGEATREAAVVGELVDRRVDGLLVVPTGPESALGPLAVETQRGTPLVFLDAEPGVDLVETVDVVRSDHYLGSRQATRHLLNAGHRRLAYVGDDAALFSARLRVRGFRDELEAAGVGSSDAVVKTGSKTAHEWSDVVRNLMNEDGAPTAIFSAQNLTSLGALQALHSMGLQHRVAHIGFDDLDLAPLVQPSLSVMAQNPHELGRLAAGLLFERMIGAHDAPIRHVVAPVLIERGSGEIQLSAP